MRLAEIAADVARFAPAPEPAPGDMPTRAEIAAALDYLASPAADAAPWWEPQDAGEAVDMAEMMADLAAGESAPYTAAQIARAHAALDAAVIESDPHAERDGDAERLYFVGL